MLATAGKVDLEPLTSDIGPSVLGKKKWMNCVQWWKSPRPPASLQQTVTECLSDTGRQRPRRRPVPTALMVVGIDPESWLGIHSYSADPEGR
jgi:hypothetical protein